MNMAAHLAVMFTYLQKQGLSIDDFVSYAAEEVVSGWKDEVKTAAEMMNAILVNVRANGGEALEASLDDENCASAVVTCLLNEAMMAQLNSPVELTGKFWNKIIPIAVALGLRFEWRRLADGRYHIQVGQA
jgi:hypothetical protein